MFQRLFLFWMCLLFSLLSNSMIWSLFLLKVFCLCSLLLNSTFDRLVCLCSVLSNSTLEKLFNFWIQWFKGFIFSRFFLYLLFWIRRSKDLFLCVRCCRIRRWKNFRFWNNVTRSPALIVKAPAATSTSTKRFF
jgi:hypothetical protein